MVVAFMIAFSLFVVVPILFRQWKRRRRRENFFFICCICISLSILFARGINIPLPDPTEAIARLIYSIGLGR